MAERNPIVAAEQAQIIGGDGEISHESDDAKKQMTDDEKLVEWVVSRVRQWKDHRIANYNQNWDTYERLWRGIYSSSEKTRQSERSQIISPALSEAVENGAAEIEEAVFGRGEFFDLWPDSKDAPVERDVLEANEITFRTDLEDTDFTGQCSEVVMNGAVYGTGIGEIVLVKDVERDIKLTMGVDPATQQPAPMPEVVETERERPMLKSVNPRNFIIDPSARSIEDALGVAIEEDVGSHIVRAGVESGDYNDVEFEVGAGDTETKPDPQTETQWVFDVVPVIRYYGKVPKDLLFPPKKTEELFPDDPKDEGVDPAKSEMVEAWVVIANEKYLLKGMETPDMMKDRPVVAYQWDIIPGKFWGRGIAEKGSTPQQLLDAELRSRMDALAYVAAPMMAMDATKLPRGFKFDVRPGKNLLLNGDPSTILKPFKFGELDANSAAQVQLMDSLVQRATGSIDTAALAQAGAGGQARTGAVSMALAPIVKRNKRTLLRYVNRFLAPALRKLMWRYMQYNPERYVPANLTFKISSTLGIMQREYETANLAQMLGAMQPGTTEHMMILMGLIENSSMPNREVVRQALQQKLQKIQAAEAQPPVDPNAQPPMDPVMIQMQRMDAQLDLAKKAAETARLRAQARLYDAQAQTESIQPVLESQKIALKGIYKTPEEQIDEEFDRRMRAAEMTLKGAEMVNDRDQMHSDERIAASQERAAMAGAMASAKPEKELVYVPEPVQVDVPVPMPGAENL